MQKRPLQYSVFTWDIEKNWEKSLLQFTANNKTPLVQIWRGISQRDNYIIPADEDAYFDLRFLLPKNFLSGREANAMSKASYLFNEELFKKDFDRFLEFYQS